MFTGSLQLTLLLSYVLIQRQRRNHCIPCGFANAQLWANQCTVVVSPCSEFLRRVYVGICAAAPAHNCDTKMGLTGV